MYSYIPACCCGVCCYTAVAIVAAACCFCSSSCAGRQNCCCGSVHLIQVFSFSSFKHDFFSMHPLAVRTAAFSASIFLLIIHIIHTSSVLRACAEPRRALAHRGGAPLHTLNYVQIVSVWNPGDGSFSSPDTEVISVGIWKTWHRLTGR